MATSPRRYGGKTAEERGAERREQLLTAALQLFGTVGFAATTIEALCAQARLHPRYFYEQFPDKETLLGAVYDRHAEAILAAVLTAIAAPFDDLRERLRVGLETFIEASLADPRVARITYFEMEAAGRVVEVRRMLRRYAEIIAVQLGDDAAGLLPSGSDPRVAAMALVGATDGLIVDCLTDDPPREPVGVVGTLVSLFAPRAR